MNAQKLVERLKQGNGEPGDLLDQVRAAILRETPVYADAFARQLEKALVVNCPQNVRSKSGQTSASDADIERTEQSQGLEQTRNIAA